MAFGGIRGIVFSLRATTNFSNNQYKAVTASTAEEYMVLSGTTASIKPVGILQDNPRLGEAGQIWLSPCITKVVAGSTLTCGKNCYFRGDGLAYSTGTINTGDAIYGPLLMSAASSGLYVPLIFNFVDIA
jgi:hypothetical protein